MEAEGLVGGSVAAAAVQQVEQKAASASAHTSPERLCLAEQDVRFPGGRCLIRLLLMLTLCIFFALSPFFLYYFLLWFDVVGI